MPRGPLSESYPSAVALVVFSLVPFLMLTAAVFPLATTIGKSLGLSTGLLDIVISLSTAGYAVGTVLAVQFAVHLPTRRMLVVYETAFVVASILSAWAPNGDVFIASFIAQGLCTSLMLIAAVPPLVTGWPVQKMPWTGMIMNLAIFGAVAIGPTIGAVQESSGGWRPLFWGVAGLAALALLFSLLTFEDQPPQDTSAPWDFVAIAEAIVGCTAAFYGAGRLEAQKAAGPASLVPLIAGAALVGLLVATQYRKRRPLMPVKQLATVFPVTGITIALFASAASFGLMELVLLALKTRMGPDRVALLFVPEFLAAVATAGVFGILFRTRFTPVLAFAGMGTLTIAAALLTWVVTGGDLLVGFGTGLVGLGVGASVSPALFLAGFSLRNKMIQRVFAMIELLRGVTAFLVAPVLLFLVAAFGGSDKASGIRDSIWICLALAAGGGLLAAAVFRFGGGRLQRPDLETWQGGEEPAWDSPGLAGSGEGAGSGGSPVGAGTAGEGRDRSAEMPSARR